MNQAALARPLASLAIMIFLTAACSSPKIAAEDSAEPQWRTPEPENTIYLETEHGQVIIELNPQFAPKMVAQFKQLVRSGFYNGLSFYRVLDGFVVQGGQEIEEGEERSYPDLPPEFERDWSDDLNFVSVQKNDLFAPETGFIDGFAVARDMQAGKVWLTHCPGVIAIARSEAPDSGRTEYYIVIGQAPRYLDRNLTIFGRVLKGMPVIQQIKRGPVANNGIIEDQSQRSRMKTLTVAADLPQDKRIPLQVINSNSPEFQDTLNSRRHRSSEWFHHTPPQVLDVCQVPLAIRETAAAAK